VNIKAKTRYVAPLVATEDGPLRINMISKTANHDINSYLNLPKGGYYTYFDFDFKPYEYPVKKLVKTNITNNQ
jgi:hypothetical protein